LGFALLLSACSDDYRSPTQPPTIETSQPPTIETSAEDEVEDAWRGSSIVTAVTGPEPCAAEERRRLVGQVWERSFSIDVSGTAIIFTTVHDPSVGYVGTIEGNEFSAEDRGSSSATSACGRAASYYAGLTGRFSEDQRTITAREFWALRLESGGELRTMFEMTLERQ
jgi:hypothetical protein